MNKDNNLNLEDDNKEEKYIIIDHKNKIAFEVDQEGK